MSTRPLHDKSTWTWIDDGKRDQNCKYADLNVELKADTDAKATD